LPSASLKCGYHLNDVKYKGHIQGFGTCILAHFARMQDSNPTTNTNTNPNHDPMNPNPNYLTNLTDPTF